MDHSRARNLFLEIQSRPYRLSIQAHSSSQNCFFKGIELLQKLGIMGYTVRGRVGETYWDPNVFPAEILVLFPQDILHTHFFVEAHINGKWRLLDASLQPSLAKYGFTIGSWESGGCCFPITRLYTQKEALAYQEIWKDHEYQRAFFERGKEGWAALDNWFAERSEEHFITSTMMKKGRSRRVITDLREEIPDVVKPPFITE